MRNHQVTTVQPLLKKDGSIKEPGWSTNPLQQYDRDQIKASKLRIKEWDYYLVTNERFAVAFTISDNSYVGLYSVSFIDFTKPMEHTETILSSFPMGRIKLPQTSLSGITKVQNERIFMEFIVGPGKRIIHCNFSNFDGTKDFRCNIVLEEPPMDSMVIATPFKKKPTAFYYNRKVNCMHASGTIRYGKQQYRLDPSKDFGMLDWGRGVWTYNNTWYWGTGSGIVNGKSFGFNVGYGFGDTSAATENMLFYDGVCHKLDDVTFHIPSTGYEDEWTFTSSDGRFETTFQPIIDRKAKINKKIIMSDQHQTFGRMNGTVILDDGTKLHLKDFLCSAEHVHNRF